MSCQPGPRCTSICCSASSERLRKQSRPSSWPSLRSSCPLSALPSPSSNGFALQRWPTAGSASRTPGRCSSTRRPSPTGTSLSRKPLRHTISREESEMTTLTETKARPERKPLPAPNSDFYQLAETLSPDELAVVKQVRAFMETNVAPIATKYWAADEFPFELLPAFKALNVGGVGMQGYGCRGGSALLFGLVAMEMSRVDSSIATFFGVHNGLAMGSIYLGGSEEQKQKWLPPMARMEKIGCFGLTEPLVGSGAGGGLLTTAKREGDTWVLNGEKKWIGNSPWCDISIIWVRDVADKQVKAFVVEK